MNARDLRRRLVRKTKRTFLAELRKQYRRANEADKRDKWKQFVYLPE